ncbi:MAG: type IV pilin protein [Gammaproteobacteria bacterium]
MHARWLGAGYTLLELLIVVAILAIVAGIALPLYNQYALRTYRAEAQADLMACAQGLERLAAANFRYRNADGSAPALGPPLCDPMSVRNGRYQIVLAYPGDDDSRFQLTATPVDPGPMAADGPLTYDDAGNRGWDRDRNGSVSGAAEQTWQD